MRRNALCSSSVQVSGKCDGDVSKSFGHFSLIRLLVFLASLRTRSIVVLCRYFSKSCLVFRPFVTLFTYLSLTSEKEKTFFHLLINWPHLYNLPLQLCRNQYLEPNKGRDVNEDLYRMVVENDQVQKSNQNVEKFPNFFSHWTESSQHWDIFRSFVPVLIYYLFIFSSSTSPVRSKFSSWSTVFPFCLGEIVESTVYMLL